MKYGLALLFSLITTFAMAKDYPNYGSALIASKADGKPVVVAFTASWCGPCRSMKANVFADAAVQKELADNFHFYLMDTDEEKGLARKFGISSLPTVKVIDANEKVLATGSVMSKNQFLGWLAKYKK